MASTIHRASFKLEVGEKTLMVIANVGCLTAPKATFGELTVTNFRLIYRFNPEKTKMYSGEQELDDIFVPHTTIFKVDSVKENSVDLLIMHCRDFRREIFSFPGREHSRVQKAIESRNYPKKYSATFAREYKLPDSKVQGWQTYGIRKEYFDRQRLDPTKWRIISANKDFTLCETYPRDFIVPASVKDTSIYHVAQFRTKGRVPALCWVNPANKAALWRCAQLTPIVVQDMVGMAKIRCREDEDVLMEMKELNPNQSLHFVDCGGDDSISGNFWDSTPKQSQGMEYTNLQTPSVTALREDLARFRDICINRFPPKPAAQAYQPPQNLALSSPSPSSSSSSFSSSSASTSSSTSPSLPTSSSSLPGSLFPQSSMGSLPTSGGPHRATFSSMPSIPLSQPRDISRAQSIQQSWFDSVQSCRHLSNISSLLTGAHFIVTLMTRPDPSSVVLQSPNGDELCSLLVALAQIMMDPYYRSIKGFAVLFEKEWLGFGHKFIDLKKARPGTGEIVSTIFTLFLDSVWQLLRQYPQSFEFSETLLLFLADAIYSCQFGTFMFSTERERVESGGLTKTLSVWSYVPSMLDQFRNSYYAISKLEPIIHPNTAVRALAIWNGYYLRHGGRFITRDASKLIQTNHLRQYTSLELQTLCLPAFPNTLASKLAHLHTLNLSQNFLSFLPCEMCYLTSLKSLNIDENQLTSLPHEMFNLLSPTLTSLSCRSNQLLLIPESIVKLTQLQSINFSKNCLSDAPNFQPFGALQHLDLSWNSFGYFPTDFSYLPNLDFLDLSQNGLVSISSTLSSLSQLRYLSLGGNKLTELPSFENFQQIEHINLADLDLKLFPIEIFRLSTLQTLNLSGMRQAALPPANQVNLPLLSELILAGNQFPTLPHLVLGMTSLTALDLHANLMIGIPVEISTLTNLKYLNLSFNHLNSLTPGIGPLSQLQYLDISGNVHLKELPASLSQLRGTLKTFVHHNLPELTVPPKSVTEQGVSAIMSYLHACQSGCKSTYRMRLMIAGQENVGKTALLRELLTNPRDKKKADTATVSTDGIDISQYIFHAPVNETGAVDAAGTSFAPVELKCWDLGGQEIYATTHQFFFSYSAVYTVVWNLTLHEEFSRVEYWLEAIHHLAPQSRIILVGTHADVCSREDVDRIIHTMGAKYRKRFPALVDILAVSCRDHKGIEDFRLLLENVVLNDPRMGERVPFSYLQLETLIADEASIRDPPIVPYNILREMGNSVGLTDSADLITAVRSLHNLGTVVYYPEDELLRNIVFLSPSWLTKVMTTIITTRHTYIKNGILEHQHLPQIWREPDFPPVLHPILLALLEKFDLTAPRSASQLTSTDNFYAGSSLVPSLLPETPPEDIGVYWAPRASPLLQFGRRYQFKFLPRGFFSRLVVRLLHFSDPDIIWKNGLVISTLLQGHSLASGAIRVQLYPEMSKLYLQVDIRVPRSEMASESSILSLGRLVIDTIDVLVGTWFKVPIDVFIPCPDCADQDIPEPWLFPMQQCEQAVIEGLPSVRCPFNQAGVPLELLVPDVSMSNITTFNIRYENIVIEKEIGVGGYAVVYKGFYGEQVVAVKTMNFAKKSESEDANQSGEALAAFSEFRREIWIMSGLHHPCLVSMIGFCMKPCSIVTEFVPCGDLFGFIHSDHPLDFSMALRIALDIAKGMTFLHSAQPPLLHRDLKSPNVLLASRSPDAPVVAKVADFGLTQALASDTVGRAVENPVWLAPEVMQKKPYSFESDVYSFGVIAWELVSRTQFFGEISFMSQIEAKVEAGERPKMPAGVHPRFQQVIEQSWNGDPGRRPPFSTLVRTLLGIIEDEFPSLLVHAKKDLPPLPESNSESGLQSAFSRLTRESKDLLLRSHTRSLLRNSRCLSVHFGTRIPFPTIISSSLPSSSSSTSIPSLPSEQPEPALGSIKTIVTSSRRYISAPKNIIQVAQSGEAVSALYVRPDLQQLMVGTTSGMVFLFDFDLQPITQFQATSSIIFNFNIAQGNLWISFANRLEVYSSNDFKKPRKVILDIQPTTTCYVSKMMWVGTASKGVCLFDGAKPSEKPKKTIAADDSISAILMHGKYVWLASGMKILRVPRDTYRVSNVLHGHKAPVTALVGVGAEVWSSSADLDIRVWDGERGVTIKTLSVHTASVTSLCLVSERIWSGSVDNTIRVWNAHDCTLVSEDLNTYDSPITAIATASAQAIFVASAGSLYLWNASN